MTERLRKILKGGKLTPATADEIAVKYAVDNAGGGADLPEPGTAGNVLTSTGDGWESAAPKDASELVCTLTFGENIGCDTRVATILSAYAANRPVRYVVDSGGNDRQELLLKQYSDSRVTLYLVSYDSNEIVYNLVTGYLGDTDIWTYEPRSYMTLPSAAAYDNGKILAVQNGAWAAVSNPNAPYIVHMEVNLGAGTATVTDGKTVADILAVADSNPFVFVEFPLGLNNKGRLMLVNWDSTANDSNVYFAGVTAGAKGVGINGTNDGTADTWTIVPES